MRKNKKQIIFEIGDRVMDEFYGLGTIDKVGDVACIVKLDITQWRNHRPVPNPMMIVLERLQKSKSKILLS